MSEISLARAERHIFSLGVEDLASELCRANMAVGLAKIHWAQQALGLAPDALFIGGPDMTVTRNLPRWGAGFAYGGKLDWSGAGEPLLPLEVKPNVCGMLVAEVEPPAEAELRERRADLQARPGTLEEIPLEFDLDRSNHFVDLLRAPADSGRGRWVMVLHGAAPELRDDNRFGWGLYWDRSETLCAAARRFETPWGPLHVLVGTAAERYLETHRRAEDFAARRRLHFARRLFGEVRVISNALHQGLSSTGEMYLGCHPLTGGEELLPFMVAAGEPAWLLRGRGNLTGEQLARAGVAEQARELGAEARLARANLLPHGAGYRVPGPGRVTRREEAGGTRVILEREGRELDNPREMLSGYRSGEVLQRTLDLGLGEVAQRLEFAGLVIGPAG